MYIQRLLDKQEYTERQMQKWKEKVNEITHKLTIFESKVSELADSLKKIESRLAERDKQLSSLSEKLTRIESDLNHLNSQWENIVSVLKSSLDVIQSRLKRVDEVIVSTNKLETVNSLIDQLEQTVRHITEQVQKLDTEQAQIKSQLTDHDRQIRTLTDTTASLIDKLNNVSQLLSILQKDVSTLNESLAKKIDNLDIQMQQMQKHDAQEKDAIVDRFMQIIKTVNEPLMSRIDELANKVSTQEEALRKMETDVSTLKTLTEVTKVDWKAYVRLFVIISGVIAGVVVGLAAILRLATKF